MAKYLSNRQKNLKIGIVSYTESNTVLEVTGKVGIGTTNAQQQSLYVVGDGYFSGDLRVSGVSTIGNFRITPVGSGATVGGIGITYYGDGSNLTGTILNTIQNIDNNQIYYPLLSPSISGTISSISVSSDSIVFNPGTNSLGIGSTQPTARLDVIGDAKVSGILTAANILPLTDNTGVVGNTAFTWSNGQFTNLTINDTLTVRAAIDLADSDVLRFGDADDVRVFYDGTANDLEIELETAANQIAITDNGTYKVVIKKDGSVGIGSTTPTSKLSVVGDGNFTGVVTATTFIGNLTGIAASATKLVTPRTFEITGDIVASPISFDGTGNVSLAATIQPNSVGLGTDTFGDYVRDITGTANQITVTGGTGEGSTPTVSIPIQFTAPQDVTVTRDLQVDRNLNVTGNITIGGTSATLFTETLTVSDAEIVLGYRTDAFNNDASNDTTANHGGIAVASTEGTPLVRFVATGIETLPPTYKKILWFKSGTFSGLGTDAWLMNYAVGIGSTQFPTGTRLAAGSVQFTENDLAVVRNINASGVVTATTFVGALTGTATSTTNIPNLSGDVSSNNTVTTLATVNSNIGTFGDTGAIPSITVNAKGLVTGVTTVAPNNGQLSLDVSGIGLTGSATFTANQSGSSTFTVTSNATDANTPSTIVARDASGNFSATTITANLTGTATTATNLADAANITTGTINSARLSGTYNINVSFANTAGIATVAQGLTGTPNITVEVVTATRGNFSGIITSSGAVISGVTTSNGFNATTGNDYKINGTSVLTSTILGSGVVNSSLTSVGTLTNLNVGNINSTGIITATRGNFSGIITSSGAVISGVTTIGVNTSSNALRINQLGTGNALVVEDSTNPDATPFVVNADGSVGIGTTNPEKPLHLSTSVATPLIIQRTSTNNSAAEYRNTSGSMWAGLVSNATGWGVGASADLASDAQILVTRTGGELLVGSLSTTGTSSQKLQVNSGGYFNGSVGIGTTNPTSKLDVLGNAIIKTTSTGDVNLRLQRSSSSGRAQFTLESESGSQIWRVGLTGGGTETFSFFDGTQNALQLIESLQVVSIDAPYSLAVGAATTTGTSSQLLQVTGGAYVSGSVGIGVTNPQDELHLGASSNVGIRLEDTAPGGGSYGNISYNDNGSGINALSLNADAGNTGANSEIRFAIDGNDVSRYAVGGELLVGAATTTGTASQKLQVTGGAYVSGSVGIGTTNPTSKLSVVGDGNFTGVVTASSFSGNASSATFATSSGIATFATSSGIATFATNAGIATYADNAGIATFATSSGIATFATNAGIATYADNAGISTNLKGGLVGNIPYQSATDTTVFLANGSSGTILQSNGVGNAPSWITAAPAGAITGLTVRDEGTIVGSANSVSQFDFVGSNISVASTAGIATITIADNLVGTALSISGISTLGVTSATNLTAQQLNVSGVSTLGITTFTGAVSFGTSAFFGNDDKIILGDGRNIEIFSGGSNSIIDQVGTGDLILRTTSLGDDIILRAKDDVFIQVAESENAITCNSDGSVELYYDNSKEFETTGYGATVFGVLQTQGLQVSGVSTFSGITTHTAPLFGTQASFTGVVTASSFSGNASSATYADNAGIATYATNAGVSTSVIGGIGSITQLSVSGITTTGILNVGTGGTIITTTAGGLVGINTINPGATLNVVPTSASIAGLFSGTTSSDMVRITQLGAGNALVVEDSANPDATPFVVNASGSVGIGSTTPTSKLSVEGDGNFSGVVTATSFSGSGTNLTGIVTSIVAGTNITVSGSTGQVTINSTATGGSSTPLDILEVMLFA